MDFLHDPNNKEKLFTFVTSRVIEFACPPNKSIPITSGASVASTGERNGQMSIWNHEEADTRVIVHILHALEQDMKIFKVHTGDTDLVTILIGAYFSLAMTQLQVDIWVAFGMGKNSINAICSRLGEAKLRALYQYFTLWLVATLCQPSRERSLHGKSGKPMEMLLTHLCISCQWPFQAPAYRQWPLQDDWKINCHHAWQNQPPQLY